MTAMEGGSSGAPGAATAAAAATPTPGGGALVEIPLEVYSGAAAGADVEAPTSDNGLPPRGRGVSRAVADILTVSGKPVRATLAGCKLAGAFHACVNARKQWLGTGWDGWEGAVSRWCY